MKAATADGRGRYSAQVAPEAKSWFHLFRDVPDWLVVAHLRPDADTLGSAIALARLIRRLGNRAVVVCADPVAARFPYMPDVDQVVVGRLPEGWPAGSGVVALDAAEAGRLGALEGLIAGRRPFVNIDHHISNDRFGSHNWIDHTAAATGEMVYLLFDHFGEPVDRETARALYAAIATDTSVFRYPATTPRTLEVASQLVATGLDFARLIEAIYERLPAAAIKLLGLALAQMRLAADGKLAWTSVPLTMFREAGASEDDAEGIVEKLREIDGVELFYILRESEDGGVRVSLRSKGGLDVNRIAAEFGGGGHRNSAGCTICRPLPEVEQALLEVALKHLARYDG